MKYSRLYISNTLATCVALLIPLISELRDTSVCVEKRLNLRLISPVWLTRIHSIAIWWEDHRDEGVELWNFLDKCKSENKIFSELVHFFAYLLIPSVPVGVRAKYPCLLVGIKIKIYL